MRKADALASERRKGANYRSRNVTTGRSACLSNIQAVCGAIFLLARTGAHAWSADLHVEPSRSEKESARRHVRMRAFVLRCNTWPCTTRSCRRVHDAHQLLRGEHQPNLICRGGGGGRHLRVDCIICDGIYLPSGHSNRVNGESREGDTSAQACDGKGVPIQTTPFPNQRKGTRKSKCSVTGTKWSGFLRAYCARMVRAVNSQATVVEFT